MGLVRVERGQLVLVAAAIIAVGLAPVLFAYLQLGYHPDVERGSPDVTGAEAVDYLDRSVHDAAGTAAGKYGWAERTRKAAAVRDAVDDDIETLETSRLESGVVYDVAYDDAAAAEWASANCVSGDGKRFGDCEVDDGVVLQERAGEAVLLAVAFDMHVVGPDGETNLTVVIEVGG